MCSDCNCWHNHHHDDKNMLQNFAIAYDSPAFYEVLTEEEKSEFKANLTEDLCKIHYPEQDAFFMKSVLQIPVFAEHKEIFLEFLVWVSISEKDFLDYEKNFENVEFEAKFNWNLANNLYNYDYCLEIPVEVVIEKWKMPFVFPKKWFSHDLSKHFYEWMWEKKLQEILWNFM